MPLNARTAPQTFTFNVSTEQAGQRLDRYLAEQLADVSRSHLKRLIETGHVFCGESLSTQPAYPVKQGQEIRIHFPEPADLEHQGEALPISILYEDAELCVVDKPAGLVVHPAPGHSSGTLVNALIAHCGESLQGIGDAKRPGIVHRLDKDTSGIMVVAKTSRAHLALSEAFARRTISRRYFALVWGAIRDPLVLDGAMGRDKRDRKRMTVVHSGGKSACTRVTPVEPMGEALTLISCKLDTGRTHQIRVHLAHAGHPLVGDPVYLRRIPAFAKLLKAEHRNTALDFPRQALHAAHLGFQHPTRDVTLEFSSPLPEDFSQLLSQLRA